MMIAKSERYPGHKKWLWGHSIRYKGLTLVYVLTVIIASIATTYSPIVVGDIIDIIIYDQNASLDRNIALLIGLAIIASGMHALFNILASIWAFRNEFNIRNELFKKIQSKPVEYHNSVDSGKLMSLTTNDVNQISNMYIMTTNMIYNVSTVVLTMIFIATQLDLILSLFFIPFVPVIAITFKRYREKLAPYADKIMVQYSNMATTLQDSISGAEVVRSFTAEEMERDKFGTSVREFRDTWIGQNIAQARYYPTLIIDVAVGLNFLLSIYFVTASFITVGVFIALNLILLRIRGTLSQFHNDWNSMELALSASSRIFETMDGKIEDNNKEILPIPHRFNGSIEFRDVTFYHGTNGKINPVLDNVSFTINPNQRVALVGPTGCGKTTIAKLLLRFYTPQSGSILVDGIDIQNYDLDKLRQKIGYIEQDIYLFPRSIRENILFGKQEASDEELLKVAQIAQISEFVEEMPETYETKVGDRGVRLSGGQRQRIAIARALMVDPSILILDDASSAIDSATEEKIVRSMNAVMQDRTTIVITHRLHAIRASDKILVLKQGKIVAEGDHEELIISSNDYRRIYGKQIAEVVA